MSHDDRLTRHLRALAEAAVPDGLRPDPPLSARVRVTRNASRRRGVLTLAAALIVAALGLVLLSRVPDAPLTAAQGPTTVPSALPTETPRPELVSLVLDTTPQTIALHGDRSLYLLAFPETSGDLIVEVVAPPAASGPLVVGTRPDVGPLFSFDPALTQRLRLALAESPGDLTLFLDPGDSGGEADVTLRAWVEAPADAPQPIPALDVPDGMVAMTLPDELTSVLGTMLEAGQAVDVYTMVLFADAGDGEFQVPLGMNTPGPEATPGLTIRRVNGAAPVLAVTDAGIALAVSPQNAVTLTWLIEAGMPFTLVRADTTPVVGVLGGPSATPAPPPGKVAVALPLQPVSVIGGDVAVGQTVDVYLTFMYVDVDEDFQALLVTPPAAVGTTIASPLLGRATGTPDPAGTPQLTTQRTVQNAEVLGLDTDMITLAVSTQDATVLIWAIDAQLPITLIPVGGE